MIEIADVADVKEIGTGNGGVQNCIPMQAAGAPIKEWYTAKELAGLPGMPGTERAVQLRVLRESWQGRERQGRGGGNEYRISSLPQETRDHLIAQAAGVKPPMQEIEAFAARENISLSPTEIAEADVLKRLTVAQSLKACQAYSGREKLVAALAAEHQVHPATIRRWAEDVEGWRVKPRTPRIQVGRESLEIPTSYRFDQDALAYALAYYGNNWRAGIHAAYQEMRRMAEQKLWRTGDYSSFTRIIKKIPSPIWQRLRKGAIGMELGCAPKIIRQWSAVPVQSVLCGDQKIFDYIIYDPKLDETLIANGYFWMDCASRAITGCWVELGHYNSYTVGYSLREALHYGLPDEIYTDWGSAEGSHHIAHIRKWLTGHSKTGDFNAMSERCDAGEGEIRHRKAQAGKPWVKPIENIMNIVERRLMDKGIPGYRKRALEAWENKEAQAMLKAQAKRGELINVEDFIQQVFNVVDEHNHSVKKLKEGIDIIPAEFFAQGRMQQSRIGFGDSTLSYICLPCFQRKPLQSTVRIKIRGEMRGYYHPNLSNYKLPVQVSVDPYDRDAPAVIVDLEGNFIDGKDGNGLAEPWNVQDPYDTAELGRKIERKKELTKWINENARRLREGFGRVEPPTPKITPVVKTAVKVEQQKKIYEFEKENWRLGQKRLKEVAAEGVEKLREEFAHHPAPVFVLPTDIKERYVCWLGLDDRSKAGGSLSEDEEAFYKGFPETPDYRVQRDMHAEYGSLYIARSHNSIQEVSK